MFFEKTPPSLLISCSTNVVHIVFRVFVRVHPTCPTRPTCRIWSGSHLVDLDLSHVEKQIEPSRADCRVVHAEDDLIAAGGVRSPRV
jgi:hypothetical protein